MFYLRGFGSRGFVPQVLLQIFCPKSFALLVASQRIWYIVFVWFFKEIPSDEIETRGMADVYNIVAWRQERLWSLSQAKKLIVRMLQSRWRIIIQFPSVSALRNSISWKCGQQAAAMHISKRVRAVVVLDSAIEVSSAVCLFVIHIKWIQCSLLQSGANFTDFRLFRVCIVLVRGLHTWGWRMLCVRASIVKRKSGNRGEKFIVCELCFGDFCLIIRVSKLFGFS